MPDVRDAIIQQRVRSAAGSSLFGAAIMLYFTYGRGVWIPSEGLARAAGLIFSSTLEFGGWALAITAVLLFTGKLPMLAVDAVVCGLIGILLALSGLLVLGGGLQAMINIIFGVMFGSSGWRSWREFSSLRNAYRAPKTAQAKPAHLGIPAALPEDVMTAATAPLPVPEPALEPTPELTPELAPEPTPPLSTNEPAPEGFLSQFAAPDPESSKND